MAYISSSYFQWCSWSKYGEFSFPFFIKIWEITVSLIHNIKKTIKAGIGDAGDVTTKQNASIAKLKQKIAEITFIMDIIFTLNIAVPSLSIYSVNKVIIINSGTLLWQSGNQWYLSGDYISNDVPGQNMVSFLFLFLLRYERLLYHQYII